MQRTAQQLRQSWSADPATASLPFPGIELLPPGVGLQTACGGTAQVEVPGRVSVWCQGSNRVVLDPSLLALRVKPHGDWALAYWIGMGLAESVLSRQNGAVALSPAAANLQANCVAGVLIGAVPGRKPPSQEQKPLGPALVAYGASQTARMGTRPQRAYALLTGFGATGASCSDSDMAALANGTVPDPATLAQLEQLRDERASSSLMAVIGSRCRPRANAPCPRRIGGLKAASPGIPKPSNRSR
ncbi:hypothetical protein VB738_12580 [Cyanobium gracile UHCC 0139]|uniref:Uncharacterized protein n=1 Tax=Cyanobium gracile UHCC 0139 TaxID=3110308 RepID=A0ABU5RWF2_9CYAN|nr:hypothetical protein [Cyanobium gracile]MEA5392094.1 hypothetical protein [Cyanobium gracile UHCC 0139]